MNDQVRAQEDEDFHAKLDRRKAESRARIEAMNAQEEARASEHKSTMQELEELRKASSRSAVVPTDPNAEIYPQADVQLPEDELTDYPKGVQFYEGRDGRLDPRQNISVEEGRYDLSGLPLWKQRALRGRVGEQVDYSSVQPLSNPMGGPELTVEEGIERAGDAQQDFSILSHSLNTSGNPDQYARDVELGEKEGVHPFVISQDRETYEQRDNMRMMSKYLTDAPKTKQAMTSPQFYEVAYDSVENLSLIEQAFNKFGRLGGSTVGEAVRSAGSGVRGVGELYESNIVMPLQRALYQIPGFQEADEAISEVAPIPYWLTPSGYTKTLGGTVADIGEGIVPEDQTLDEKIAGAVGQIAGAVGLSLTPAGPSATIGMFAGMGADQQAQQMRELGLDPNQMPAQVATGAVITGLSEQLRLGSILKLLPQSVRSKAMGNVFARITGQAGEEAIQEAAENIAHNALSMTYDENAELLEGAGESAVIGGSASAIFQTLVEVILPGKQRMTAARDAAEVAKEMRKEIEAAPFFERAPEKAKEFLDGVTEDQEVYINPEDFLKLYQEDTETYYKILEEVGVSREEVEEAVTSGSDIAVKGSAILTVSDSEQFNALVDVMRTDPDAMSTYQVRESLREKELEFDHERMLELYEQDDSETDTYTRVSSAVQEAAVSAGRSPQEAEAAGSIWGARFKRLEDDGIDAQKVFEKLGLQIRSVDEQGQPIQKTIRDFWTGPKPKEPQSLNKWIASQGGISEAGMGRGDVMQAIGQKKSAARGVFNENGTPLDMMARQAAEAGFDVDPEDVQSLLDAISNDTQGGMPLYRAGEADEWNAYQEALDQVEEANTDKRGDVEKLTQAQDQGYEGEDIGEAIEWTEAIAKGLDMSQKARMQRARDMGFDTDVVMYRGGGPYDESAKRPVRWFSDDASIASDYAQEDGQAVSAFYINKGKQLVLGVQGDDWSEISVDKIGVSDTELMNYLKDNYGDKITTDELADEIEQSWDDEYDSILFKDIYDGSTDAPQGNVLAVIWPDARAKIRSVNAAFDPDYADSPNILRQFAGPNAANADLDAQNKAESMEAAGVPSYTIWEETGWFRGPDGNWRWEFDDSMAQIKERSAKTLDGLIDHPLLFSAYPKLGQMKVDVRDMGKADGGYDAEKNTLYLSETLNDEKIMEVVLHEIQHGIQTVEGIQNGADPRMFSKSKLKKRDPNLSKIEAYRFALGEVEARNTVIRQNMTTEERRRVFPAFTQDTYRGDVINDVKPLYKSWFEKLVSFDDDISLSEDFSTPQARKAWVNENTISEHIGGKGKSAKRYGFQINGSTNRVVVQLDPQWEEGAQVLTINQADLKRGRVGGELDLDADGLEGLAENLSAILSQNLDFPVTVEVGNKAEQDFFLEVFKQVAEDNGGRATKAKGLGVYYTGPKSSKKVTKADASPVGEKSVDDETKFFNKLSKFTSAGYGRAEARGGDGASETARRTLQAQEEQAEREAKLSSERSYPFPQSGLYQKDGKQAHGFVEIPKGGVLSDPAVVVSLTKSKNLENAANASTFIHETAHIFLELEMSLENESPAIKARMDAVREWLGIEEGARPTVAQHEKFAESFEAYLLEGKSPNAELRGVFRKFRTWLLDIYVELRGKRKLRNLEPAAREIFDGMLATQVEIEQAQRDFMGPLASAMRDVMSPEQIEKYKKYALEAGELAKDKLFAKYLDGIKKREGRERRQQRKDLTADVTERLMELPVFKAQDAMTGATGRKLNTSDVVEMRGDDNAAKTKNYHTEGGEHPELVAPGYGFLSGDEMLQALEEAPTLKTAVKSEVDRMMIELHGDMLTDGTMEAEAVEAVFNDKAVKAMEVERNAMAEKAAGDPIPLNDIKAYAEYLITKKPIKDILTPAKYAMQGRNLHKKAVMLAAKGKWDEALNTAHKAMLQHELARRAYKAREEFEKHDRFLKRFSPRKMGKDAHKKFAPEYVEQINRYYALPGADNQQDEFAILNEFALQQAGEGNAVLLNNDIIANQPLPEIRDMTMEQLRDYRDGMQNLNHLGRKNHAKEKEAFLDKASNLGEQVTDAAAGKRKVVTPKNPKWKDKLAAKARAFDSVIIRWPFLVEALQGGLKGDVVDALDTPVRKALSLRNSRRMTETKKFAAILKEHGITQSEMSKRVSVPELDAAGPLRFEALLALAQHMGTEQNRDRISSDPSISGDYEQIIAILDKHFEKRHWDATQEIWNLIDSMRDESFAVHRRETGVLPKAVSASSFTTKYGTYKGGYSPIKYDMDHATNEDLRKKEIKDIWEQQIAGVSVSAQTKKGFLQERQENVSRPLRMDLTTVLSHIDDVTNDIYMREPINQVWKLVQNSDFRRAVRSAHGKEYLEAMETIIQRTVAGAVQPDKNDVLPNLMRTARVNFSTYLLGFNLVTAGLAPVSYLQTVIPKYGSKIVIRGMSEYYGGGESGLLNSNEFIKEKSTFMRERVDTLNREAHDMLKRNKLDSTYGKFQGLGYVPMTYAELATVSGPVWLGVYRTRLDEGYSEADAITEADRAVATTQGSGLEIDQSVMQSGNELQKWMTWMYGYVSGVYGIVRNDVAAHDKIMSKLFPIVKHLVIYNILASTAEALLRHGISDDEEDPFYQSVIDLMIRNSIGLVPGVSGLLSKYSNETALDDTADKVREAVGDYFAVGQEFMEDGRVEGETIGNALGTTVEAAAMAVGVPGGAQVKKIAKTLSEDDDPTLYEALVTGPDDDN